MTIALYLSLLYIMKSKHTRSKHMKKRNTKRKRYESKRKRVRFNSKRHVKKPRRSRKNKKGGVWPFGSKNTPRSPRSPTITSSSSEPTSPTSSYGSSEPVNFVDFDKLDRQFGKTETGVPGKYREAMGEKRCSRIISSTSPIKSCVEVQELTIENKDRSCEEIQQLCSERRHNERLPSYMVSSNKKLLRVPCLTTLKNGNNEVLRDKRDHNKVILYSIDDDYIRSGRCTPITRPSMFPGENGYNTLEDEIIAGHVKIIN